jgi:hypothetical protein
VRIYCSLCGDQIFDLHLCLSASVNVRSIIHTQPLGLYNKILVGNLFVHHYFSSPPPFLAYLINSLNVNTRNCNANAENNDAKNNNAANPPPTLEYVLMIQDQMLQTMVNMQNAQPQAPPPLPRDRLGNFKRTKPPTFSHSVEPLDTDDWLKSVEKKLQVVQCNN